MNYIIGTGYWSGAGGFHQGQDKSDFFPVWYENTMKYSNPMKIIVVNHCAQDFPPIEERKGEWINLAYNHGHIFDKDKNDWLTGWAVGFLTGAMIAYANKCDFIYKEQDCLAFNNWVEHLYDAAKDCQMVMGTGPMNAEVSLVLIKYDFIPKFIAKYLSHPLPDRELNPRQGHCCNEYKFVWVEQELAPHIKRFTIGAGRHRPIVISEAPFYAQKIEASAMKELKEKGFIKTDKVWEWRA